MNRAVITVVGKDAVGILAGVSGQVAAANANVIDVSQTVLDDIFSMVMLVDTQHLNVGFDRFVADMKALGERSGVKIHAMHEDIFGSMHRV